MDAVKAIHCEKFDTSPRIHKDIPEMEEMENMWMESKISGKCRKG